MIAPAPSPPVSYEQLKNQLGSIKDTQALLTAITSAPFDNHQLQMAFMFLGFMVLYLVDPETNSVRIASVSDTEHYRLSVNGYNFETMNYEISMDNKKNSIVKAITTGKPQETIDWATLGRPGVPAKFPRANQANSGIAYSCICPLDVPGGAAMLFAFYQYPENVGSAQKTFMKQYAGLVTQLLSRRLK